MRAYAAVMCAAATLAVPVVSIRAQAQPAGMDERAVVSGKDVWIMLPPDLVAQSDVRDAKWSPDGAFVIASRGKMRLTPRAVRAAIGGQGGPPPTIDGQNAIVLWNRRTGTSQELWHQPIQGSGIEQLEWMAGKAVALAVVTFQVPPAPGAPVAHRAILRIDAGSGTARSLGEVADTELLRLSLSPTGPVALCWRVGIGGLAQAQPDGTEVRSPRPAGAPLSVVRATGAVVPVPLPEGLVAALGVTAWTPDGHAVVALAGAPDASGKAPAPVRYALDPATGRWSAAPSEAAVQPPQLPTGPLAIKQTSTVLKEGDVSRTVRPIWLEARDPGDPPRMLVCAQGEWAKLSPTGDGILYSSQGAVWVSALMSLPAQVLEDARRAARRTTAISNAKQMGLALLMYAQDFDGKLPADSEYSNGLILPYVKNERLFEGFSYTYEGGKVSDIASPADTQLGFSLGPGGRAIIYADGHVVWKED